MRVVHVGAYPPPYGGITSHVKRLDWFCRQDGISSVVIDSNGDNNKAAAPGAEVIPLQGHRIRKLWRLLWHLTQAKADIVHFHLSGLSNFIWGAVPLLLVAKPSKCLASLHSGSFISSCESLPQLVHPYARFVFRQFAHLLAANPDQRDYLVKRMHIAAERISIIPAFLPPIATVMDNKKDLLPSSLLEFCNKYTYTALVSGFAKPYYGFHTTIQAFDLLKDRHIGLIIKLYTATDEAYMLEIRQMAGGHMNIYIAEEMYEEQMIALLNRVSIFIRATSKDGDSVALREAAYFGRQIIASDCIDRPEGCLLYAFGDERALAQRLCQAMSDPTAGVVAKTGFNNGLEILNVYRKVINYKKKTSFKG